jgi:hypothetical protein
MPDEPEVLGLLALMLLIESRRPARVGAKGELVRLADQDRALWDRDLIGKGQAIVRQCLRRGQPGPYQIQAAINAVHADAAVADVTDWHQILQLYDQLLWPLRPDPSWRSSKPSPWPNRRARRGSAEPWWKDWLRLWTALLDARHPRRHAHARRVPRRGAGLRRRDRRTANNAERNLSSAASARWPG